MLTCHGVIQGLMVGEAEGVGEFTGVILEPGGAGLRLGHCKEGSNMRKRFSVGAVAGKDVNLLLRRASKSSDPSSSDTDAVSLALLTSCVNSSSATCV